MNASVTTAPFAPTRWTLILRARGETPEAKAALSELCDAYYQPVLRFLRREGRDESLARELAQEFFARILQHGELGRADPARGRFRSYLLGAVKHFLADERKHRLREKRGGGVSPQSLDAPTTENSTALQVAVVTATLSDAWFDRQWALTVMARALGAVEIEFLAAGKATNFSVLKPWLVGEAESLSQADAARQLDMTEGALKVAIHRLRKRFRDSLRAEIGQTVAAGADVEEELRYLVAVLAQE
jgi:DNA-directed RNA polymerase specialized sigma24 family protein